MFISSCHCFTAVHSRKTDFTITALNIFILLCFHCLVLAFGCILIHLLFLEVNHETLNILKYVRPGGGFVPKFPVFGKVEVNGLNEEPIFTYLKVISSKGPLFQRNVNIIFSLQLYCLDWKKTFVLSLLFCVTGIITICEPCYW